MSGLTVHDDFERFLVDWLDETAGQGFPGYLDETLVRIADVRQRPAWMSPGRWLPMRTLTMQRHRIPSAVPLLVALALIVALAIAAVAIVGSSQTRLPPPFGLAGTGGFAYDSGGDLFIADPDGSNARAIVSAQGDQFGPTFSRDGTRLAYWSTAPGEPYPSLWVSDADGRHARQVATDLPAEPQAESPAADWSPDGRELAFVVGSHLFVVGADGTGLREIGDPRLFEARADPAWSPDGSLIAVFGYTGAEALLHVIEPDGGGEQLVGGGPGIPISYRPAWSPDGSALVYSAVDAVGEDVVLARRSGSTWQEEIVVSGPTVDSWPRFSNDGTRISFVRNAGDGDFGNIVIADTSGSNQRPLRSGPIRHASHCWAPDDRSIMAVSGIRDDPKPGHVLLSVDGSVPPREIPADDRVAYFACSWQRLAP
jgi:Tol biopolymer transport system component